MAKFITFFLAFLLFFNISLAERRTFLNKEKKDKLYLLLKEDLAQINKFKEYIKKNKTSIKKDKNLFIKLLILNYRLDDLDTIIKLINKVPINNYSDQLEKDIIHLISNYILLNFNPEKAIIDFENKFYKFIILLPSEKFRIYTNTAIKIGKCDFALKLVSYEIERKVLNPFFKERLYNTAYCFYKRKDYNKSFLLFNRLAFAYPNYKKNLVKQYLIHIYIKTNKKSPALKNYNFENLEKFLFKQSLLPPNKDIRIIYLDLLVSKKEGINDNLFNRGVLILGLSQKVLKNKGYKFYLAKLINKNIKFLSTTKNDFLIVQNYFFSKRKGLKLSDLERYQRNILFNSLIKFNYYDEAKQIYKLGNIDYNVSGNSILTLFIKENKKIPNNILKKLEKQKEINPELLLKYFIKINPNLKKSKKYLVLSLEKNKNLNFLPSYLNEYFGKKRFNKLNYYKGILNFQINEKNFLIFLDYLLALYKEKNFKLVEDVIYKFEKASIKDNFVSLIVSYTRKSILYRKSIYNDTDLTIDDKIDIYRLWLNSINYLPLKM